MHFLVAAFDVEFFDFRAAVKDMTTDHRAVQIDPFFGAMFRLNQPFQMNFPRADEKIKIALPIARLRYLCQDAGRGQQNCRCGEQET